MTNPPFGTNSPARFVILEHRRGDVHWDVMLERGESLRTWAVDEPIAAEAILPARSLPDHRLAYLDYEGPISGDRGAVRRIAAGTYRPIEWADDRIVLYLDGDQLRGELTLLRTGFGAWSLRFVPRKVD